MNSGDPIIIAGAGPLVRRAAAGLLDAMHALEALPYNLKPAIRTIVDLNSASTDD